MTTRSRWLALLSLGGILTLLTVAYSFQDEWRLKYSTERFDHIARPPAWAQESSAALLAINDLPLPDPFWDEVLRRREIRDQWAEEGPARLEAIRRSLPELAQSRAAVEVEMEQLLGWLRAADGYPVIYDMVEDERSTILKYSRVRAWAELLGDRARALAAEGRGAEALGLLAEDISHWRRVTGGSWSMVSLMIGTVCLKRDLAAMEDVIALDPAALTAGEREWEGQLGEAFTFKPNLSRVLKMEYVWAAFHLQETYGGFSGLSSGWHFRWRPTLNAMGEIHFALAHVLAEEGSSQDLTEASSRVLENVRRSWTNRKGIALAEESVPAYAKVLAQMEIVESRRAEMAGRFGGVRPSGDRLVAVGD
ncbi:MAG: hypothetical protein ACLFU2_06825 [Opitutales bacterium]